MTRISIFLPKRNSLTDSLVNIIQKDSLQIDSLETVIIAQKDTVPSFFTADTAASFSDLMPLLEISKNNFIANQSNDWFTIIVFALMFYMVIIRFISSFNIMESLGGILKIQSLDTVGFDKQTQITGVLLSPLAIFVYAFYLYFLINPNYLHLNIEYLFGIFAAIVVLLFLVKSFIEKAISIVFGSGKNFNTYFSDHLFLLGMSGLIQSPLLIIYFYSGLDVFLWASVIILAILWLFRLFRGFIIAIKQTTFSKSFIILYLCSLEILPIVLAVKLVSL